MSRWLLRANLKNMFIIVISPHYVFSLIMYSMKNKISIILFFSFTIISLVGCKPSQENLYTLSLTEDSLVFDLDPQTSIIIRALFPYTDRNGQEFLTFQNDIEPEILWYDVASQKYVKTIKLQKEGNNGVGLFCGYYISSENEIYIPETYKTVLDIVNDRGEIIRKIDYEKTSLGKSTIPFLCTSYKSMHILNGKIFIPQTPNLALNDVMADSPVTLVVDTVNHSIHEFDVRFPQVMSSEEIKRGNTLGVESAYSMCYNGKYFVYSFFFDEDLYIVSLDGKIKNKIKARSKYLEKVYDGRKTPVDMNTWGKTLCEIPMYGNLIYDKYREVYYRIIYLKTELKDNDNYKDISLQGRTKFSIMILDKNLNLLGETLFPDNTYASNLLFVRADGLYISTSFVKNPTFSDDKLCFRRFDLIQIQK